MRSSASGWESAANGWELGKLSAASGCESATQQINERVQYHANEQMSKRASENDEVSKKASEKVYAYSIIKANCSTDKGKHA